MTDEDVAVRSFCRVAIDSPVGSLDRPFDYSIPERMAPRVAVGSVVRVVLHGRNMRAFVTDLLEEPAVKKTRALSSLVSGEPIFDEATVELARWTARRYVTPLGLVLHDQVPGRFSTPDAATPDPAVEDSARPAWLKEDADILIAGGSQACVLPPSVAFEAELVAYLVAAATRAEKRSLVICPRVDVAERLGSLVGGVLLHGEDRPQERAAAWAAARDGKAGVVVGGRSALFVPIEDLGLVVVASAHDRSLKSERAPRLHALIVARERARAAGAAFVVSSPAPPLDIAGSMRRVESGQRSLRPETARPKKGPVTPRLLELIGSVIGAGEDVLVFSGRRGDVLRLRCADCGWTPACPDCGTALALGGPSGHRRLSCRMCGATAPAPEICESCRGPVRERGWGHERIAKAIESSVEAPVVRIVAGDEQAERSGPAVIVGTLAAVHAVRDAGAVCVADLDQLLGRPDFRAAEVALQTLHEIGDSLRPGGRYLVQTREPDHHVVQAFMRSSYRYFLDRELPDREETSYPPYGVVVRVESPAGLVGELRTATEAAGARVVGAVARRGRTVALVRAPELEPLLDPLRAFALEHPRTKIDVDPVDIA